MEINEFISTLKQSFEQSVVWHHQTTSFSEHKALQNYYEEIIERLDGLIESIQGVYGRIDTYTLSNPVDWSEGVSTTYFKGLYGYVQEHRKMIYQETWVQNQIDNISELIASTLYQLSLK
jgi:pyruvate/oxaloacetate carboxyltransferase